MKKKLAFILMGAHYTPDTHNCVFETEKQFTCIYSAKDFEEACQLIKKLCDEGFGAIELCGAFGEEKTRKLIELTEGKVPFGYVTHFEEQDQLFDEFFKR